MGRLPIMEKGKPGTCHADWPLFYMNDFSKLGLAVTRLDQAVAELNAMGARAVGIQADLFRAADCANAVERTVAAFGRLDVLVNNASTNVDKTPKSLEDATDEQVQASSLFRILQRKVHHRISVQRNSTPAQIR